MESEISTVNTITAQTIAILVEKFIKNLVGKIAQRFNDVTAESSINFGHAYVTYLESTCRQNSKIKTLLYRHEPKDIYSFYECVGLQCGDKIIDTNLVGNVIENGKKIVITGTGGIGKSVMLKHLFLNCVQTEFLIPVLLELRGLNYFDYKESSFFDYVFSSLCTYNFKLERKYFEYSLEVGKYLFLMDGFDEIRGSLSEKVSNDIRDFCNKYPNNYYIISSRPQSHFIGWSDFCELSALPLTKSQALSLIDKLEYDPAIKARFYSQLESTLFDKYKSFAANPLLLTIMLITYENSISIPDNLNDFYEQAFSALFHTHDATKGAYKRDILSGLSYEDFKRIFSHFCFKSFFKSDYEFYESDLIKYVNEAQNKIKLNTEFDSLAYIKDLTESVCMLISEGLTYKFSHRSFQEYFAALYVTYLSDENQKKLLLPWLREEYFNNQASSFLQMLSDLQSARFATNILLPILEELTCKFEECDNDIVLLFNKIYGEIKISERPNKEEPSISITVINNYLHTGIIYACKNYGFKSNNDSKPSAVQYSALLEAFRPSKRYKNCRFLLEQAADQGLLNEATQCIHWAFDRIQFALACIKQFKLGEPILKRKFESILEEL